MRSTSSSSIAIVTSGATAATRCTKSRPRGGTGRTRRQRSNRSDGFTVDTEALAARRQHAQRIAAADRTRDHLGGGVEDVLGVIEDEEDIERAGAVQRVHGCDALSCEAERRCNRVGDARRLTNLRELDEAGAQRLALRSHAAPFRRRDGVLPTPPVPISVTTRASSSKPTSWARSSSRPTNDDAGAGARRGRLLSAGDSAGTTGAAAGVRSPAITIRSRSRSTSDGSRPASRAPSPLVGTRAARQRCDPGPRVPR